MFDYRDAIIKIVIDLILEPIKNNIKINPQYYSNKFKFEVCSAWALLKDKKAPKSIKFEFAFSIILLFGSLMYINPLKTKVTFMILAIFIFTDFEFSIPERNRDYAIKKMKKYHYYCNEFASI